VESIKFISLKTQAVAHEQTDGVTKHLRVYKIHRARVTALDSITNWGSPTLQKL